MLADHFRRSVYAIVVPCAHHSVYVYISLQLNKNCSFLVDSLGIKINYRHTYILHLFNRRESKYIQYYLLCGIGLV